MDTKSVNVSNTATMRRRSSFPMRLVRMDITLDTWCSTTSALFETCVTTRFVTLLQFHDTALAEVTTHFCDIDLGDAPK